MAATELTDHKSVGAAVDDYNRCKAVSAAVNRLVRNAADDCPFAAQGASTTRRAQAARGASSPAAIGVR